MGWNLDILAELIEFLHFNHAIEKIMHLYITKNSQGLKIACPNGPAYVVNVQN